MTGGPGEVRWGADGRGEGGRREEGDLGDLTARISGSFRERKKRNGKKQKKSKKSAKILRFFWKILIRSL